MWGELVVSSIPIFALGIGIFMFSRRNMSNWENLKREAKAHIWTDTIALKLALLLCALENETEISSELKELRERAEEDTGNMENNAKEYATYVANEIPYMPEIFLHVGQLREPLVKRNKLDSYYEEIPRHRKWIGLTLCVTGVLIAAISLVRLEGIETGAPYVLLLIVVVAGLVIAHHLKKHETKKGHIEEHGNEARRNQS